MRRRREQIATKSGHKVCSLLLHQGKRVLIRHPCVVFLHQKQTSAATHVEHEANVFVCDAVHESFFKSSLKIMWSDWDNFLISCSFLNWMRLRRASLRTQLFNLFPSSHSHIVAFKRWKTWLKKSSLELVGYKLVELVWSQVKESKLKRQQIKVV